MDKNKSKYRRVAPEDVQENARKQGGGRGISSLLRLPRNIGLWEPERTGTYEIDIVPYVVSDKNHPDEGNAKFVPGETLWYKREIRVHLKIGPDGETVICPTSAGLPCPICQERAKLVAKSYDQNETEIKALSYKKYVAFNILDPEDKDAIKVFVYGTGKFWSSEAGLKREIDETEDSKIIAFYDFPGGKTLKVRFSEDTYEQTKYLTTTKIEFIDRGDLDEAEILEKVADLDTIAPPLPYEKLKALFYGAEPDGDSGSESPTRTGGTSKPAASSSKGKPDAKPASAGLGKGGSVDQDDRGGGEKEKDEFEIGQRVSGKNIKGKKVEGEISDIDDNDIEVTDDEGDTHDCKASALILVEPEDKDTAPDRGGGEKESNKKENDNDNDEIQIGDTVKNESGDLGEVLKVDLEEREVTVQFKGGKQLLDLTDVMKIEPEAKPELKVGDKVSWDDGDKEGEVVKVKDDGSKVRVKDEDDTLSWVASDSVVLVPIKPAKRK